MRLRLPGTTAPPANNPTAASDTDTDTDTAADADAAGQSSGTTRTRRLLLSLSRTGHYMSQVLGLRELQDYLQGNNGLPLSASPRRRAPRGRRARRCRSWRRAWRTS